MIEQAQRPLRDWSSAPRSTPIRPTPKTTVRRVDAAAHQAHASVQRRADAHDPKFDRTKYDAIGESDRMTLKFRKPAAPST